MEHVVVAEAHINGLILRQYRSYLRGIWADFGCGDMTYTKILAKHANRVYGLDLRQPKTLPRHSNVEFWRRDIRRTSFDDAFLDGIITFHTLEHIKGCCLQDVPKEMRRVLKIGGHVIVSVPFERAYYMPEHVNFFNADTLQALFKRTGFKVIECYRDRRIDDLGNKHDCVTGVFLK